VGLWNWIVGNVAKGSDDAPNPDRTDQAPDSPSNGAAVATLEPPSDMDGSSAESPESPWWAPQGATLSEPPPVVRPDLSTEARALENSLVSQFDGHNLDLPPLPRVPERVLQHLHDPQCEFARVADDIAEDQVIAAAVLRMANSPLYRGVEKMTTLKPAISRLGANALRALMLNQSMRVVTAGGSEGDKVLAEIAWRRSLAGAAIMRGLSAFTSLNDDEAFLIGLLHDIGNVIVLREVRKQHRHVGYQIDIDTFEYLCSECHQEFGELIADAWSLPAKLKVIVTDHHTHPEPDDPLRTERLQVQLTDIICALLGYAPEAPYDLLATRAAIDLGLAEREDFTTFLSRLPGEVDETVMHL